ncbi:unnamed protein product [Rhizophagus irregularis]|nr:unnamed protein product [Rhizophagus irregularis]
MDKYRFLSTILYNIGGFGGIFHTQYRLTGNGCYRISAGTWKWRLISACELEIRINFSLQFGYGDRWISAWNSEIETGDFGPELRNGDRFRPGTQKWRPISAQNSEMETDFSPELENGDRF